MKQIVRFLLQLSLYGEARHTMRGRKLLREKLQEETVKASKALRYGDILRIGKKEYGKRGILMANLGLSLPGFFLMAGADYAYGSIRSFYARIIVRIIASAFCMLHFDAYIPENADAIMKFLFIAYCAFSDFSWTLTYLFLVIYENIFCLFA